MTGLAEAFQKQLSEAVADVWHLATRRDWDWPITEITDTVFQPTQPVSSPLRADRAGGRSVKPGRATVARGFS